MSSIKKVAERAKVSTATVSHVINQTRFVSESTKKRVYQAMEELDYFPNSVARSLRSKKSKNVGIVIPMVKNSAPFFMEVAQGLENTLQQSDYSLLIGNTNEDPENEKRQIRMFCSQQIDGLVIASSYKDKGFLRDVLPKNIPVVFVDRFPLGIQSNYVVSDGRTGTLNAIELLITKGHRKIGFIGENKLTTGVERFKGYKDALLNVGIDQSLIRFGTPNFDSGYSLAKELVNTQKDLTALFFATNAMLMGGFCFLKDSGVKIPEEIAIIGFDDYDWTKLTTPSITVVKQRPYELGAKAATILLEKIQNVGEKIKQHCLPTELILRDSC